MIGGLPHEALGFLRFLLSFRRLLGFGGFGPTLSSAMAISLWALNDGVFALRILVDDLERLPVLDCQESL